MGRIEPKETTKEIEANYQKEQRCARHEFEAIKGTWKYKCKHCGFEAGMEFVAGYERGLEHGLIWARELEDGS